MKPLDSLCALFEPGFPVPAVAAFLHGASIFSPTELSAQPFSPSLPQKKERSKACNENHDEADN